MEIKISKESYNPLLKRKEVSFSVKHPSAGTPPSFELRKELAAKLKSTLDQTFIIKLKTKTGTKEAVGEAQVYDSAERAKSIVPAHIAVRNLPPEERKKIAETKAAKVEKKPREKKAEEKKPEPAKPAGETK